MQEYFLALISFIKYNSALEKEVFLQKQQRRGGLPGSILKIEKKCPDFGKKTLIVSILGLNLLFKI